MSTPPDEAARDDSLASPQPASPADLLFPDLDEELSATRRTLAQVPDGHADWSPHDKSMTLGELASHLAELPGFPGLMLAHDEFDMSESDFEQRVADDTAERLEIFDEAATTLRDLLDDLSWDRAMAEWTLRVDGEVLMQGPRSVLVRSAGLSHMAHHRAQLGVYLRLLDVPLPRVYGPTADAPWGTGEAGE